MKLLVKATAAILILVLLMLASYVGLVVKEVWLFVSPIMGDICVKQVPFEPIYNLESCSTGNVLVNEVDAWIPSDRFLYGSNNEKFFLIILNDQKVIFFDSMNELNEFLLKENMPLYDINDEMNVSHIDAR